jgi:carboxyl-terminal processing protease
VLADPDLDRGHLAILSVYSGSAADHAGLQPHDRITAVDGVAITTEGAAVAYGVRGPVCSLVTLTVVTPGQPQRQVAAVRAPVTGGIPIDARLVPGEARIGYVMVPTLFDRTIPDQVRDALSGFGELDGLILDLRVNGGGSGEVFEDLLGMFISGPVGEFVSRDDSRAQEITREDVVNGQTVPLVVLIDTDTESFAEVMAGILSAEGRAMLIGETTTGNVETLHSFHLNDGSVVWLATERFVPTQDPAADWGHSGIVPDIEVVSDWVDFTFASDPAIPAALESLTGG